MISKAKRSVKWLLGAGLAIFLSTMAWILIDGLTDDQGLADIGVILGGKVYPSGKPSDYLKARLDHGLKLYREGRVQQLLVSGGVGKEGHDEAVVMSNYLVANGVPPHQIMVDHHGDNTRLTAKFAGEHSESVMVISQYFHITRSKLACRQAGIDSVCGSAPSYFKWSDLFSAPREVLGLWAYLFHLR